MIEILLVAILAVTAAGALLALLAFVACRRSRVEMPLSRLDAGALLRAESDLIRSAMEANSRELRQERLQGLNRNQQATFETMVKLSDSLLTRVDEAPAGSDEVAGRCVSPPIASIRSDMWPISA